MFGSAPTASRKVPVRSVALPAAVFVLFSIGIVQALPASADDTRGSFVAGCDYSHSVAEDPLRFPGLPGASHMHDFFGSDSANGSSTRESVLASDTSCKNWDDTAAYWAPAASLHGVQITPIRARAYYFGDLNVTVQSMPKNLAMIAGNHSAASAAENPHVSWNC